MSEKRAVTSMFFSPPSVFLFLDQGLSAREHRLFRGRKETQAHSEKACLGRPSRKKEEQGGNDMCLFARGHSFCFPTFALSSHTGRPTSKGATRAEARRSLLARREKRPRLPLPLRLFLSLPLLSPLLASHGARRSPLPRELRRECVAFLTRNKKAVLSLNDCYVDPTFFPLQIHLIFFISSLSLAPHAGIGHVPAELSRLLATIRDLDERSVGE